MEPQEELLAWAEEKGITLDGIRPQPFPGRGIGIITTRKIKPGELLLEVPTACLRTLETVPRSITSKLPRDMSVHGLLAAELALDKTAKHAKWNAVMPTRADLAGMPLVWPAEMQALLPAAAAELLRKQRGKLARDWAAVSAAYPSSLAEDDYRYAWLLVNTRTFYHVTPRTERLRRDDHMVLQPVADLFNHADAGCAVAFDEDSFSIRADRAYAKGEEVHICYGRHSNDFLLAEYGFVLLPSASPDGHTPNRWDEARLDEAVLPELTARQRQMLEEASFLGGYVLDAETVCHRTQVALRAMCVPLSEWRDFVDGTDDGERHQEKVDRLLVSLLRKYARTIDGKLASIDALDVGEESQRALLRTRWEQILALVTGTIDRLTS
ncbi:SET domain-containing protein [Pleurostoma richardsiae]|uniref:SET domain-containing protein n=1 Tax=Pleurostoma richardsiae TaxID=41990 RepID=A0AA38VVT6_9PEZI|nr:SET domain-containing protein [Pleurostoma richardsiae]